jgi:hypothetical protein
MKQSVLGGNPERNRLPKSWQSWINIIKIYLKETE